MTAGTWDLRIEQGATLTQTYTVTDDGWTWTGWTARAQIRTTPFGELLLDLTGYLTVVDNAVQLSVPAAITGTLTRSGVWDLEMVNGDTVLRLLQGRAIVSLEVTQ